jgi:hypothetical protein
MKIKFSLIIFMIFAISISSSAFAATDSSNSKIIGVNLVNQDPDPAIAGNIVEIRLGIENRGGKAAENIVMEINPKYPFEMVPGENPAQIIGSLKPYQDGKDLKIIKYKLRVDRDANQGRYELDILEYESGQKDKTRAERTVSIDVKNKESAEVIYIDKVELVPGKQTSLKFTINNVGSAPLRDLTFSWENEKGTILPVGSDDTKYIKYIDISDMAELTYDVIADSNAEPGLYKLRLSLKYDDPITDEEKEISTNAGVYVGGATDFDVAYAESSSGETSFSIANIGSNPSYSVSISVPKQEGWEIKGSNSVIIGNLNKGDYTVAGFKLQPLQKENQEISLKIEIAYTDTTGKREVVEKEVTLVANNYFGLSEIDLAKENEGRGRISTGTIVIALLIVGLFYIYRRYHNFKKKVKK